MRQDWEVKKLGDVCKTGAGGTPLKAYQDYYEGGDIPWLLSGEVNQRDIVKAKNFITEKGLNNSSAKLFPKNTVLVAMYGATAGQVGILRFEASTNQAVCGILPNNNFLPEFLYYYFLHKKEDLIAQAVGNAQPNISQIKIKNTLVPVLCLSEQQRIVEILDEALTGIATIKANTERNLQNARELFQSYLQSIFSNPSDDWEVKKLGEVLQKTKTINPTKTPDNEFIYIDVSSVNNQSFKIEKVNIIQGKNAPSRARKLVRTNDVIFATVRPTLRRIAVIPEEYDQQICSTGYCVLRSKEYVNNHFIFYYLLTDYFNKKMETLQKGASYPAVTDREVKEQIIPIPPLSKQQEIVEKLDTLSAETKRLEENYQQKLNNLEELKKSILQKAFNGELT